MPRHPHDPALLLKLGERIRALREAASLSQQRLADLVSVKPATISMFERGAMTPTLTTCDRLARALGVRLSDLFEFDRPPEAPPAPAVGEEVTLLDRYRRLSRRRQAAVRTLVDAMGDP